MSLFILAYLAGVLTILSPCILPVVPFILARANQSFHRRMVCRCCSGLAFAFAAVASLAAVAGGWAVEANRFGRAAALVLLAGLRSWPDLSGARRPASPRRWWGLARGWRHGPRAGHRRAQGGHALVGRPRRGHRTALDALRRPGAGADPLGRGVERARSADQRAPARLRPRRRHLAGRRPSRRAADPRPPAAIAALGRAGAPARRGRRGRQRGAAGARPRHQPAAAPLRRTDHQAGEHARDETAQNRLAASGNPLRPPSPRRCQALAPLAALLDRQGWINAPPLRAEALRGKVVVVSFWTYSCINCLRALPHLKAWADTYKAQGLVVIGVHTPEFAFERDPDNVARASMSLGVRYPVVLDNDFRIWRAFGNTGWPGIHIVGADGRVRHQATGEGRYDQSEQVIRRLLAEANAIGPADARQPVEGQGTQKEADWANLRSPETYLGHDKAERFASPGAPHQGRAARIPASCRAAGECLEPVGQLDGRPRIRRAERRPEAGCAIASMPATCISCWFRARPTARSGFASGSTAPRREQATARTSTSRVSALSATGGSTSSCARPARSRIEPSRSSSSIRACAPTPSPSAEPPIRRPPDNSRQSASQTILGE
jgi:thiol-disulfide isomerase/thioredoxin